MGAGLLLVQLVVAAINLSPLIDVYTVAALFDVNGEANPVAWLSSTVLLATACGAGLAAAADRSSGRPRRLWLGWVLISALFTLLSLDETAALHELAGEKAHRFIAVEALPSLHTWVLVVAPIGLVAAILLVRWVGAAAGLRSSTGRLTLTAVALWLAVPVLEALDPSLGGPVVTPVIEEGLEMAGEALMLMGVLLYLGTPGRLAALASRFAAPAPAPAGRTSGPG